MEFRDEIEIEALNVSHLVNQLTIDGIGYGFASEEDAALFGLGFADSEDSKPEISVVNLGSYTQIDPNFLYRIESDQNRSHSDPQIKTEDLLAISQLQVDFSQSLIKHT